jgi:hypothetical protein
MIYLCIYIYTYIGNGTVPENDLREQGSGNVLINLVCGTVPRCGCHVLRIYRFLLSVKCAEYLLKNSMYQTGTLTRKRTESDLLSWETADVFKEANGRK